MTNEEMDRWLAEKVMNLVPYGQQRGEYYYIYWYKKGREPWKGSQGLGPENFDCMLGEELDPYKQIIYPPPPYSTDIAQAFMVVEKIKGLKTGIAIEMPLSGGCYVQIWKETNYDTVTYEGEANTPAMAICKAVRMAIEGVTIQKAL